MKRFIRTLAGKTVLFIVCVFSVCLLAASIAGIILYTQNDLDFYLKTEQDLKQEVLVDSNLRSHGYSLLWNKLSGEPENSYDFHYRIMDGNGRIISESEHFKDNSADSYALSFGVLKDEKGKMTDIFYHREFGPYTENAEYYTVFISLIEGTSTAHEFNTISSALHFVYSLRYAVYPIALIFLLLAIACFIVLMYAAGRKPDTEELFPGPLHKIPFDLLLVFCSLIGIGLVYVGDAVSFSSSVASVTVVCIAGLCLIGLNIGLGLCMSAAGRIKQRSLIRNTVICCILKLLWDILRGIGGLLKRLHRFNMSLLHSIPLIWKTCLVFFGISVVEFLVIVCSDGILWLIEKLLLLPFLLHLALTLRRLQKSGMALAGGDLTYHTETKGMLWDFKQHGDNLNSIAGGMALAVEARMKSERMKTELITNVSHDIKTPLTSIINYASLIGEEPCDNSKIKEYAEVLVRQSERLKRLTEDLVEASRASTGNLDVTLAPCDASVFLTQASGEYEEKLQNAGLTLIVRQPEKEIRILADGRRMWRIFDNLMNNICKYAQSGTRVYLSLEQKEKNAVITFKNTSREPLDMTEEELMERFTRGDSSRNTEGNGLGLSIAKSMAELQGGSLTLAIDGDLFKAVLSFPAI